MTEKILSISALISALIFWASCIITHNPFAFILISIILYKNVIYFIDKVLGYKVVYVWPEKSKRGN